ncbi:hypothetical protein G6F35_014901 [Rhizopus arrhizus]|nr:hypothetical protein G6F35_014901 [Rhizopus arrhizus]
MTPNPTLHAVERRAHAADGRHPALRQHQRQGRQRNQDRRPRNARESGRAIQPHAGGRAQRIRGVDGHAHPGHDAAGILRPHAAHAPAERAGGDQAFRASHQRAARQQDGQRRLRLRRDRLGQHIQQPGRHTQHEARHHGALGATAIDQRAGIRPRQQGGGELQARHHAHHQRTHAQRAIHIQRQYRHRQADHEKSDEHRQDQRQQLRKHGAHGSVGRGQCRGRRNVRHEKSLKGS